MESDREQFAKKMWQALHESEAASFERRANDLTIRMLREILGADSPVTPAILNASVAKNLLMSHDDWKKRVAGLLILGWYCKVEAKGDAVLIDQILQIAVSDRHPASSRRGAPHARTVARRIS